MGDGSTQRDRVGGACGGDAPRVLPFGVVMRDLQEGRHLVARREGYGGVGDAGIAAGAGDAGSRGASDAAGAGAAGVADAGIAAGAGNAAGSGDAGSWGSGAAGALRLSPVELRNLEMINDPALGGTRASGRAAAPVPVRPRPGGAGEGGASSAPDPRRLQGGVVDHLEVGPLVEEVEPGPHGPRARLSVAVDPANPRFSTDGRALFSKDGRVLVALLVPCEAYDVPDGCEEVGPRAFDSLAELRRVSLPDGLRRIGRLAFAKSGLAFVALPGSVEEVGEKAFFGCTALRACLMPEGLRVIGEEAFAQSGLERAVVPAGVAALGRGAFRGTPAERGLRAGALAVDARNPVLELDAEGGLYRRGDFAELVGSASAYAVRPGTRRVLAGACCRNVGLRAVVLPEGLEELGDDAFRGAHSLAEAALPSTLRAIGDRAFLDTALRRVDLPAGLERIGESALLVQGEGLLRCGRPLREVTLDARNGRFYLESGLLCERGAGAGGADKALLYVGPETRVRIPEAVNRIAPGAFLGATAVEELFVHGHLHSVCAEAFSTARAIPVVHVEFPRPVDGYERGDFPLPALSPRYRSLTRLIGTDGEGTAFRFGYYDSWASHATAVEDLVPAAIERLRHPMGLTEDAAAIYRGILARRAGAACRLLAGRGDLAALEDLAAWGLLGPDVVEEETRVATAAGNAQATAVLLELRRRRGWGAGLDLSL